MTESTQDLDQTEAFAVLVSQVGRNTTKIPAEILARHVLQTVPAHEWPVRLEAMGAVLRRLSSARKDELRIERRPENGHVLGPYQTRRKGSEVRPYTTIVSSVDSVRGRCDCPDYLKNSLGLCKHVLVVLEHLYGRPGLLKRARSESQRMTSGPSSGPIWDPVRPLLGFGDWLDRVTWLVAEGGGAQRSRAEQALRWFAPDCNGSCVLRLKKTYVDDPAKRLELVESLLKALPATSRAVMQDPALRALLVQERITLKRIVDTMLWPSEQKVGMRGLKVDLYSYQREGVKRFLKTGRMLLADDMGLGKTIQAIACCEILWRTGRIRRGLIIAPASLKPQWAREWAHFSDLPVEVIDGNPSERQAIYSSRADGLFIINYEQLIRDLDAIRGWQPDLVVLDEAQRIKNWATKTALSVKGLNPPYRLVLTGTPMENRIEELASIVEWVDDSALEPKWRLPALHAMRRDGAKEVVGVRNLETIRERLRPCMIRRVRQEVLDQLPPRTDVRIPIEMTEPQREEHDALNQPIAALVSISAKRPLTQAEFLRLMSLLTTQRIISNGLAQLQFTEVWPSIRLRRPDEGAIKGLSAPKLLELRQLVRQLVVDQKRKIVIFSQWRRMLHLANWAVADILGDEKLRCGFFTGAEKQSRRTQNIVEFHDDPDFRLLLASDAGGVGLNLQRAASCVINLELPWNPAVLEQRIGRIYRLGQKQPIDVYNLVSEQGIESRIADLVGNKQAFFKGLFDGESDSVRFDQAGSFLARVQKLYESEAVGATGGGGTEDIEPVDLADIEIDDDVADPFEELIDAGNEAQDSTELAAPEAPPDTASERASVPHDDDTVSATECSLAETTDVRQLFSRLQVRRESDGKVVIEAPAEAATTLCALFEGMARLLQTATDAQP